jgi:hypothetical protein
VRRDVQRASLVSAVSAVVLVFALAASPSAGAATQLGQVFGSPLANCSTNQVLLNAPPGSTQYIAPSRGVITSWSFQANASPPTLKLKVARPAGANTFTIVGQSVLQAPAPNVVSSFLTRVPMEAGDVLGFYVDAEGGCANNNVPGFTLFEKTGDVPPGSTATFTQQDDIQLDISAILEPDADNDGFGDETQDQCPTLAAFQDACPVPDTTITKGPKAKTKKKTATFEFGSSVPGANTECNLDGAGFQTCTSPRIVKVGKGRHHFEVRAISKGQPDPTPATFDWKVKKKKRK